MTVDANKAALRSYSEACRTPSVDAFTRAAEQFYAPDAKINVVHPFNEIRGPAGYIEQVLSPLTSAFPRLRRSDYIAFGGAFEGADWVTCTGYYSGFFAAPWLGISPTGALAHLRFGEFHKMQDGRAVESYIYFDIPELMIAAGQWPIDDSPGRDRGFTGYRPGPITRDGLQWQTNDPARGADSSCSRWRSLRWR